MILMTVLLATFVTQLVPDGRRAQPTTAHTIPLVCDAQNALVVPVSVHGAPSQRFLLDTGASITTIDAGTAATLALAQAGRIPSPSGPEPLVTAQLSVGPAVLPAGRVVTADFAKLTRLLGDVAGILGSDALRVMGHATIDYERCTLIVGSALGDATGAVRVPLEWHQGRPVIAIRGGGRLLLDSGAASVTIFHGSPAAEHLRWSGGAPSPVRVDRFDGASSGLLGRVACLSIGAIDLRDVPAVAVRSWYADTDALAPNGLLPLGHFARVHLAYAEGYALLVSRPASR